MWEHITNMYEKKNLLNERTKENALNRRMTLFHFPGCIDIVYRILEKSQEFIMRKKETSWG